MTDFNFTDYPLDSATGFEHSQNVSREVMDDGRPVVRVLGNSGYRMGKLRFVPLSQTDADALIVYLNTNRATEFVFGGFGTGYLWSDPTDEDLGGAFRSVSVDVYARLS